MLLLMCVGHPVVLSNLAVCSITGCCIIVKGNLDEYLPLEKCRIFDWLLKDLSELIEGLHDGEVISSLCALLVACWDIFNGDQVFVTGNKKMLRFIEEEASREELHAAVRIGGFFGVRCYMFIDSQGQLVRANLKWDDHTRPSDKRILHGLGIVGYNKGLAPYSPTKGMKDLGGASSP
ncbi:hypothetical protein L7F22_066718 [Adiantum nelumboides]|nr:hypothetical protein [Adiantum nelumboides]